MAVGSLKLVGVGKIGAKVGKEEEEGTRKSMIYCGG
jgi:hypothetical protein